MTAAPQPTAIPLVDLAAQQRRIGAGIGAAIKRVLAHGVYIMGPEVHELERQLSAYSGAPHVISCASGTDAIALLLMAKGLRAGDAVFVPSFTFSATAEPIALLGATPVFVDVLPDTFNIDPRSLEVGIATARALALKPKAIISVDLFGQPADYEALTKLAQQYRLDLLCDAAQSFGATWSGRKVGTIGSATATSFFPSKPLGCYGDGGAIFTADADLASRVRSLRVHGQGADKYDNEHVGMNGRLDTLQAAVLLQKLTVFEEEIVARDRIASRYGKALRGCVLTPTVSAEVTSVWAQYTVRVDPARRASIVRLLRDKNIATAVYYPKPLHRQIAYRAFPTASDGLPVSDVLSNEVLSLPMHPYLDETTQDRVIAAVIEAVG